MHIAVSFMPFQDVQSVGEILQRGTTYLIAAVIVSLLLVWLAVVAYAVQEYILGTHDAR